MTASASYNLISKAYHICIKMQAGLIKKLPSYQNDGRHVIHFSVHTENGVHLYETTKGLRLQQN